MRDQDWKPLTGIDPDSASFPLRATLDEERIVVFRIGNGFRAVQRNCPHQQASFADAFVVHSRYVAERILRERNAHTPLGILHHGSEERWRDGDRREARRALGLSDDWVRSCLVVSFGGVQPHKRIDRVLHALAQARRQRADIRLIQAWIRSGVARRSHCRSG